MGHVYYVRVEVENLKGITFCLGLHEIDITVVQWLIRTIGVSELVHLGTATTDGWRKGGKVDHSYSRNIVSSEHLQELSNMGGLGVKAMV